MSHDLILSSATLVFALGASYIHYASLYAKGMSEYVRNNQLRVGGESSWDSIKDEAKELVEAIRDCSPTDIVLEGSDVAHSIIKYGIVEHLPLWFATSLVPWHVMFVLVPVAAVKLAKRYEQYGCIRNHKNPGNRDHVCAHVDVD